MTLFLVQPIHKEKVNSVHRLVACTVHLFSADFSSSKVVVMYFFSSASFLVVGLSLCLFSYEDLGLRLFGIGLFLVVATFCQSLVGERKTSQKHFSTISQ